MLDPFIPLLTSSLSSRHVKVLSRSLQSLLFLLRLPLPSLGANIHRLVSTLFDLLRKYGRGGGASGAADICRAPAGALQISQGMEGGLSLLSRHLSFRVCSSLSITLLLRFLSPSLPLSHPPSLPPPSFFPQAMTVVLRDVKQSEVSKEELKLLLGYIQEDIHDYQRQITAFPLLKVPLTPLLC